MIHKVSTPVRPGIGGGVVCAGCLDGWDGWHPINVMVTGASRRHHVWQQPLSISWVSGMDLLESSPRGGASNQGAVAQQNEAIRQPFQIKLRRREQMPGCVPGINDWVDERRAWKPVSESEVV